MSKSRAHKWYHDEDDRVYEDRKHRRKEKNRRDQKKIKRALQTKDINSLSEMDDD